MRTTVTLDPDTEALVRREMDARDISFKAALNEAIRRGLAPERGDETPFRTPTARMGRPAVPLEQALILAGELEDEELIRKQRTGR